MAKSIKYYNVLLTYFSFAILIFIGHVRDFIEKIFNKKDYKHMYKSGKFPAIYTAMQSFYYRRLYTRISYAFNNLVKGKPKKKMQLCKKIKCTKKNLPIYKFDTKKTKLVLNIGSYDYLGFTHYTKKTYNKLINTVDTINFDMSAFRNEVSDNKIVRKLEEAVAALVNKEDCVVFPMGFGTNTWTLSILLDKETLVLSDQYNHTSIISGIKLSGAYVIIFEHNNIRDLKKKLVHHIIQGQPGTHRSWKRVFVIVEGIFSMEGSIPDLVRLINLKKKYKFYIYIDEAHSLGAIGKSGRGVCDYREVDPADIDIIIGTFSKSFCASGGFVAASQNIIDYIRNNSPAMKHIEQFNPLIAHSVYDIIEEISKDTRRLKRLHRNTRYMRKQLVKLGFEILGNKNSPVIPILISSPGKLNKFYELCISMGLATVIVGYPATPVLKSRVRLCISAAYTKKDLRHALKIINHAGSICGVKYNYKERLPLLLK